MQTKIKIWVYSTKIVYDFGDYKPELFINKEGLIFKNNINEIFPVITGEETVRFVYNNGKSNFELHHSNIDTIFDQTTIPLPTQYHPQSQTELWEALKTLA